MFFFNSQSVIVGEDDAKTANGGGAVIGGEWRMIFLFFLGDIAVGGGRKIIYFTHLGEILVVQKKYRYEEALCETLANSC